MAKKPPKPLSAGRIAQLRDNPATRHLLDTKFLTPEQQRQRALNSRLAQPVVPGSSMTRRDLGRQANAAVDLQFGPGALASQQQRTTDLQGWYNDYLKSLATNQQAVGAAQDKALSDLAALRGSLAGGDKAGTPAGMSADNANIAGQASGVRQALLGSFGAMLNDQGAAAKNYASALANVVGPGQRLQGLVQAKNDEGKLRSQMGAYKTKVVGDLTTGAANTVASQAKNDLAAQALGLNSVKTAEQVRHDKAAEANQSAAARARADAAAGKVNQYGYTAGQWKSMSVADRQKVIRSFKTQPKAPKPTTGLGSQTTAGEQKLVGQLSKAVAIVKANEALPAKTKDGKGQRQSSGALRTALQAHGYPPEIVNSAFDIVVNGYISPVNVKALHRSGVHIRGRYPTKPPVRKIGPLVIPPSVGA